MKKYLRFLFPGIYLLVVIYLFISAATSNDILGGLPLLFSSFPAEFLLYLLFSDFGNIGFWFTVIVGVVCNTILLFLLGRWVADRKSSPNSVIINQT